jgi:hypothetical protein
MTVHPHLTNSYSLKIFRLTPYNSEILVRSRPQVHCFHRSEGEGVPRAVTQLCAFCEVQGEIFERDFHPLSFMPKKRAHRLVCP